MRGFSEQVVLVTGAAGNLGHALAVESAARGARCVLLDVHEARLREVYGSDSDKQVVIAADNFDVEALRAALQDAAQRVGAISVVFNTVGGFAMGEPVHRAGAALWQQMSDLNVASMLNVCAEVVPPMEAAGYGKIVNVAANAALRGQANMGAYCATKAAVVSFTQSMAAELRDRGINVNCVMPSIIDTPQNRAAMADADFERWVKPESLARVMAFLASDEAADLHGVALPVVGLS